MRTSITVLLASILLSALAGPAIADFEFADADLFSVEYRDQANGVVTVGIADATGFRLLPWPNGVLGKWTIPVLGRTAEVYLGFGVVDGRTTRWTIGVVHLGALPQGWRIAHVDRRFALRQKNPSAAASDVLRIAKVNGPTSFSATITWDDRVLYPNFLQTQQATLVNATDGKAISLLVDDHKGHRKFIGYRSSPQGTTRELWVRSLPENLAIPTVFVPDHDVLVRGDLDGLDEAIDWYRSVQKANPNSFLSRRSAVPQHPLLAPNKFVIAPGAVTTSLQVGSRYDITSTYRNYLMTDFGNVHGNGMIVYHLGWEGSTSSISQCVWPDVAQSIMPGHQALINQARSRGHRNIPYFLPVWTNVRSKFYDPTQVRTKLDGSYDIQIYGPCPDVFGLYSWQAPKIGPMYDQVIIDTMIQQFRFDGVYLDALSASDFSYNAAHNPPVNANEQLNGISNWITGARLRAKRFRQTELLLANETPTEVFGTDVSALDLSDPGAPGLNLFRRTYSGREWPTVGVIGGQHPILYSYTTARVLVDGARPLVVWPEWTGKFPLSAANSDEYDAFHDLLQLYSTRFSTGFDEVIDGFLLPRIKNFQVTMVPPVAALAPCPTSWKQSVPAVLHGVFKPTETSDRRVILLARWTDPDGDVIDDLNLPRSHPLWNSSETVVFNLSKKELGVDPRRSYTVYAYDTRQQQTQNLGRLPIQSTSVLRVTRTLSRASMIVLFVIPS